MTVTMTCMTTKRKFDIDEPECVMLRNGRYAYRCDCPWEGKNGKKLRAFKFCSKDAYLAYTSAQSEHVESEQTEHSAAEPSSP